MRSAKTNQKSIRLNPNIPLTRKICADSAGYAPQALVPLYDVNSVFAPELSSERNLFLFNTNASATPRMRPTLRRESLTPSKNGGARRDRTDDLMLAKHALSQLSYGPYPGDV
jgi:hypothetical protein